MVELPSGMDRFCAWNNTGLTEALSEGENEWSVLGAQGEMKARSFDSLLQEMGFSVYI